MRLLDKLTRLFRNANDNSPQSIPLPGRSDIEYRDVDPDRDFETAYAIFRETISPSVMALNNGVWPEEERKPFFRKGFTDDGMAMLLHNGKPIGCFCITELDLPYVSEQKLDLNAEDAQKEFAGRPTYKAVVLQRMYIDPAFQGKGIGKTLMNMALERARQKRLPLELEVLLGNDQAIRAYEKNGYETYSMISSKGWNKKYLMRQKDTEQYMPGRTIQPTCNPGQPN